MLSRGNQLKAARALMGLEQEALAALAGVDVAIIQAMEAHGADHITSRADLLPRVQRALESAGVEFLNHGRPGVRLRSTGKPDEGLRPDQLTSDNDG